MQIPTQQIYGLDFINIDDSEMLADHFIDQARTGGSGAVITPNTDILVTLADDRSGRLRKMCESAKYVLPDGQPLVWGSRLLGRPLQTRVTGSGIFELMWPKIKKHEIQISMLVARESVEEFFAEDYWRVNFEIPDSFDANDEVAIGQVVESLTKKASFNDSRIVLLGLGFEKNTIIGHRLLEAWSNFSTAGPPLVMGFGAAMEMYSGHRRRAPNWVQRAGMEWFFRFVQEPRRLFSRYFVRGPRFAKVLWDERQVLALSLIHI